MSGSGSDSSSSAANTSASDDKITIPSSTKPSDDKITFSLAGNKHSGEEGMERKKLTSGDGREYVPATFAIDYEKDEATGMLRPRVGVRVPGFDCGPKEGRDWQGKGKDHDGA